MTDVNETLSRVVTLYEGRTDIQGEPYWKHCYRVYRRLRNSPFPTDERITCAALLHDTIEDGLLSRPELYRLGYDVTTVSFILDITRRLNEPYNEYIQRVIKAGKPAIYIKLADLIDNLDISRGPIPATQRQRYFEAQQRILMALMKA